MKKKFLLSLVILAMLVCVFAISASADTIVSSTSDAYGELCVFDEAIGNTNISQLKDDGTVARTVLSDGNGNYYTIPTVCTLTESYKNRGDGVTGEMFLLSFGEISSKLGFTVTKNSIIRIELPSDIKFICNGNENLSNCNNMVECVMNDGVRFWDNNNQRKLFTNCKKLKSIDVSGMIMEYNNTTFAMFEYCPELEYVKLPNAYQNADGTFIDYNTTHMFSGCNKLKTIENMDGFFKGDKTLNYKTFYNCYAMPEFILWDGLETIEGRAFGNCRAITEIVIPDSVTVIGTTETVFESCTALKKVVLPKQVSLGSYCFEKCTALQAVWMPSQASTFGAQVFGQCGSGLNVTFYFTTAESTITVSNTSFNNDPFLTAIKAENDARLQYNTPTTTKCVVFFGNHTFDINTVTDLVYTSFLKNGTYYYSCPTCDGYSEETPSAAPLFGCKGFSASQAGNGISLGFTVDSAAIDNYTSVTGKTVKYGVFAGTQNNLGTNDIFDATVSEKVITAEIKRTDFTAFDIKVVGFETDEQKSASLALGAYVALTKGETTEYAYMQAAEPDENAKYSFTSYESIVNQQNI